MKSVFFLLSFLLLVKLFGQNQYIQKDAINNRNQKAIQFYHEKKYDKALSEWTVLLEEGAKGADLYYNIANTYFRLSDYPNAILFYNRALKWNPHCGECKKNLGLAQNKAGIDHFELPEFIVKKIYKKIIYIFQPFNWFVLFVLFLSTAIVINFFKDNIPLQVPNKKMSLILCFLSLFFLLFAWDGDRIQRQSNTVIVMEAIKLLYSPDPESEVKQDLLPGTKLKCTDHIQSWLKVQTPELDFGWVEEKKVKYIQL